MSAQSTRVTTGIGRLSYCHLHEPSAMEGSSDPKYSVKFLWKKTDKETTALLKKAFLAAMESGVPKHFKQAILDAYKTKGVLPKSFNNCIVDGDTYNEEREAEGKDTDSNVAGCYFINAKSQADRPPALVKKLIKGQPAAIISENEKHLVYSGANAQVSVTLFPFSKGAVGIAAGLNSVCVRGGGDAFAGGGNPLSDFVDKDDEFQDDEEFDPEA